MQSVHNPDRFMADLRQILSQGRKRIGLLVGAGAPMSVRVEDDKLSSNGRPLIPGADELTNLVVAGLSTQPFREAAQAIRQDLGASANIETILSMVRLRERALGASKVHGLNADGYCKLGRAICENIGKIVDARLPVDPTPFNELVTWVGGTIRPHAIEIFTTNYDLLFEESFERVRAPYFDGFTGSASPFFDPVTVAGDDLPSRWARLWKLHGSIGWDLVNGNIVRGVGRDASQLIYPDHLKYDQTQKQPFASLIERMRQFLLQPDTLLLATGFSFRDAHICAVIEESLGVNKNAAVFAFQYGDRSNERAACEMAARRPNFSVYAADGAIINAISGIWSPGEPPKNWENIRATYWGARTGGGGSVFLLGDFAHFSRFCAQSQSFDLHPNEVALASDAIIGSESTATQ